MLSIALARARKRHLKSQSKSPECCDSLGRRASEQRRGTFADLLERESFPGAGTEPKQWPFIEFNFPSYFLVGKREDDGE